MAYGAMSVLSLEGRVNVVDVLNWLISHIKAIDRILIRVMLHTLAWNGSS